MDNDNNLLPYSVTAFAYDCTAKRCKLVWDGVVHNNNILEDVFGNIVDTSSFKSDSTDTNRVADFSRSKEKKEKKG